MTLREIIARLKSISPKTAVDEVREMIESLKCEHTVYPASASQRWKGILGDISLDKAVGVTFYGTNAEMINQLRQVLKHKYPVVGSIECDQWRTVFVCGNSAEDANPTIICANWYPVSREEVRATVKAMNQNTSNTDNNPDNSSEPIDLELSDDELFS
jgi:hypothetical protein